MVVTFFWDKPDIIDLLKHNEPNKRLINFIGKYYEISNNPVKKVLDVGCGYGRNLLPFSKLNWDLYAFDNNDKAVKYIKSLSYIKKKIK